MLNTAARELLAAIVDSSDDGIVSMTLSGTITSWNRGAERMFGYTAAETVGRSILMLLPPERTAEEAHFLSETAAGRRVEHFETVRVRQDGGRIHVSVTLSPIRNADGRITGVSKIVRDISDRVSLEDRAAADAERLNLALEAARLGDWSWDVATDVVTFSPRAAQIFAVSAGPYLTWAETRELLHPGDRERARIAVEVAIAGRTDYSIEYRLINGERERWVFASGRARYDEAGRATGMLGVVQDITRDRLLVHMDDAVRSLTVPEEITYTAARMLGQHLHVNRCAYAFVEPDEDTFVLTGNYTDGVHSIVGRYRFRQFGAECLRLMRAGLPYVVDNAQQDPRIEEEERRAYESTAIRAVICVPILKAARFVAAMAVHTSGPRAWRSDEVELVQQVASRCWESLERARVEGERASLLEAAEAANRAKDEFMAMLGHELRNPLSPILTALQLMKLRGEVGAERERTVIERQVRHLTRLVDDLLDVSRIARGKVTLKPEIVELSDVVARAVEIASPLLEERAHTLTVDVPRTGLAVEADVARLAQVVSNLLNNAAKYTPPGGRVTVWAGGEDDGIAVRVRDTGIGIPADVLPRVFDLFIQGRQAFDRAQGGLGLGLTIVKSLVERHGGRVGAHSEGPERGSEFVVWLPPARHPVPASAPVEDVLPRGASPGRQGRVLIVDDNRDAADTLAEALALRGYETRMTHDGPEALRVAAVFRPDAACLDLGLPVMDGYELAAKLKELPGLGGVRLIAVTGYGQQSDRHRTSAAGFHHHVVKPVDVRQLESLLAGEDVAVAPVERPPTGD